MHLLSYVVKCTVTDSPSNTQTSCSKCPPSAWIPFLTRVTRELITWRSPAALLMLLAALRNRCSSSSFTFTLCGPRRCRVWPCHSSDCILHLLTAEVQVQTKVSSCGIYSGHFANFSTRTWFLPRWLSLHKYCTNLCPGTSTTDLTLVEFTRNSDTHHSYKNTKYYMCEQRYEQCHWRSKESGLVSYLT